MNVSTEEVHKDVIDWIRGMDQMKSKHLEVEGLRPSHEIHQVDKQKAEAIGEPEVRLSCPESLE